MNEKSNDQRHRDFVMVPRPVLEALTSIRLKPNEYRVLFVLWLKIYGWHKEEDYIAHSQFIKLTGLQKPNISRATHALADMEVIKIDKTLNKCIYSLVNNPRCWLTQANAQKMFAELSNMITSSHNDNAVLSKSVGSVFDLDKQQ